jgi:hypothetical protein
MQASILGWVKAGPKVNPRKRLYRFRRDIPKFMLPDLSVAGPFGAGDLVSEDVLPNEVWRLLLSRGAVEVYEADLNWPGGEVDGEIVRKEAP